MWKVFCNLNLDMYNLVFLQLLDSTGHRDFLLRRIVLNFWYQHWTFIRELSWSSAHDYLLCLPEKQDHTHRWNPGHAHLWEDDQRTPFTLWGLRSVNCWGQKRPQGLNLKKTVVCLPALFCSSAVWLRMWRACAGSPHWGCDQGMCTQCLQYHVEKTFLFSSQLENSLSSCYTKWFTVLYFFFFYIMSNKKYSCNILIPVNFVL